MRRSDGRSLGSPARETARASSRQLGTWAAPSEAFGHANVESVPHPPQTIVNSVVEAQARFELVSCGTDSIDGRSTQIANGNDWRGGGRVYRRRQSHRRRSRSAG